MNDFQIVTDSNCDISQKMAEELDLEVIPMSFMLGNDSYLDYPDRHELSPHDFYTRLSAGESSSTNQISMLTFTEVFEPILRAGTDVLYIGFSSGLSGTYNNARMAAAELETKYPDRKVYAVDSLAASMGEGLIVYNAVQQKKAGASIGEVKDWVERNRNRMHHWFTVNDLNHLRRGGRISGASALVGSMLNIKPILHVDDEGHLILMDKVRGRRQSLEALVAHMEKTAEEPEKQMIFISHGDTLESAQYVADLVRKKFGVKQLEINPIGPVIGAHSGPGTVALFYLGTDKDAPEN